MLIDVPESNNGREYQSTTRNCEVRAGKDFESRVLREDECDNGRSVIVERVRGNDGGVSVVM